MFRSLFVCLGGKNIQHLPDAEVGCCCLARYLILDVYKILGRDSMRRRNAKLQVAFFRSRWSSPTRQTGEEGRNVDAEFLERRSLLCGQRESVIGKRNVDVDSKKCVWSKGK